MADKRRKKTVYGLKNNPLIGLSERRIIEGVYKGIDFEKLLQHEINRYLVLRSKSFRVTTTESKKPKEPKEYKNFKFQFNKLKTNFDSTGDDIAFYKIFSEAKQLNNFVLNRKKFFSNLKRRTNLYSKPKFDLIRDLEEQTLAKYCDNYFESLITHLDISGFQCLYPHISVSIGFHWAEGKDEKGTLRYYSTCGWQIHPIITAELKKLQKRYSISSNSDFILRLLLGISLHHIQQKTRSLSNFDFLEEPLDESLENAKLLNNEDKKIWKDIKSQLQLKANTDYDVILKSLLIGNKWNQSTLLGPYPMLLDQGEELFSDDFQIYVKEAKPNWDYSVVTSIEDFFLANEWMGDKKLKSFLDAKPCRLAGIPLGDVFVAGSYPADNSEIASLVRENILAEFIPKFMTLLQTETEFLLKFLLTMKVFNLESGWEGTKDKLHSTINERYRLKKADLLLATFEPARQKITERVLSHALQSAVASVFARNYAHNIGAHVDHRASLRQIKQRIKFLYDTNLN